MGFYYLLYSEYSYKVLCYEIVAFDNQIYVKLIYIIVVDTVYINKK